MKLEVQDTPLKDVKLITPCSAFDDFRGDYVEIYNKKLYQNAGITSDFIQDDYATSSKHVLRGIHGDSKTDKLVKCIHGSLYLVVVNNNPDSSQYKKWTSFDLNCRTRKQVFVPAGFGTSYLVMSDIGIFHYKQSTYYGDAKQFTLKWNDPEIGIWWPISNPITSFRDH